MKDIKIGILDQSIVRHGATAREALLETIETVKLAEDLGYNRFWVSEHHNSPSIAGSAPEVLMVKLQCLIGITDNYQHQKSHKTS